MAIEWTNEPAPIARSKHSANHAGRCRLRSASIAAILAISTILLFGQPALVLRDFADKVRDADVAVIYFAGYGMEIDGTNYLIPVDAVLERDMDALDEAVSLNRVLTVIEPAKQLRLVILDACRDNPFNKTMKRAIASRAIGRGLAKVEPVTANTLIAFAAKAGSTESEGDGRNSPFTSSLVKHLTKPGLDLRKAFGFVRDDVMEATNHRQQPYVYGSLGGDEVAPVPIANPTVATPPADRNSATRRHYELAERIGTKPAWDAFIAKYPAGFFAELAKVQRDKAAGAEARAAAAEKAKAAQQTRPGEAERTKAVARADVAQVASLTPLKEPTNAAPKPAQTASADIPPAQRDLPAGSSKPVAKQTPSGPATRRPFGKLFSRWQTKELRTDRFWNHLGRKLHP